MIILIIIAAIIAITLIAAMFVKKDYSVNRDVVINKPKETVFDYLKYLRNQDRFSKWATTDPDMKKTYTGIDGTVGFVSAWDSKLKNVGSGEQVIKEINEGISFICELHFIKPFKGEAISTLTTDALTENQTKVNWQLNSAMAYPMNLMLLFLNMDKMIGNDLEIGLTKLKSNLENN
jgi:uncharacterized membrane protein